MIYQNELRIGNYVKLLMGDKLKMPTSTIYTVLELHTFKCLVLPNNLIPACEKEWPKSTYNDLSPIPLTEEWLVKLGFVKNHFSAQGLQFNEPYYHVLLEARGWLVSWIDTNSTWALHLKTSDYNSVGIKTVDHLQNLVYFITGQELTLRGEGRDK
jgi:hypothetical protein